MAIFCRCRLVLHFDVPFCLTNFTVLCGDAPGSEVHLSWTIILWKSCCSRNQNSGTMETRPAVFFPSRVGKTFHETTHPPLLLFPKRKTRRRTSELGMSATSMAPTFSPDCDCLHNLAGFHSHKDALLDQPRVLSVSDVEARVLIRRRAQAAPTEPNTKAFRTGERRKTSPEHLQQSNNCRLCDVDKLCLNRKVVFHWNHTQHPP